MEKQPKEKSAAAASAAENLISFLPDEILHSVLRRIPCYTEVAQTAALSRRWRNLWRSYPVVEFDSVSMAGGGIWSSANARMIRRFQEFSDATIERFSRDRQLRLDTLKISLHADKDDLLSLAVGDGFPAVEQLLDLASKRKAEYVTVLVTESYVLCFPLGLLSNSSVKTLHLEGIRFVMNRNVLCFNSLRSLILTHVELDDGERMLANLIASSPLLETLKLEFINGIRKLSMSNVANLKLLEISFCEDLDGIDIAASGLQTVRIEPGFYHICHFLELVSPQLNVLEIKNCDISRLGMISKLEFLKSLELTQPLGDLPLLPKSLRYLSLNNVELSEEQVLRNLIAGSPFLETLKLAKIGKLRKLQLVNLPNLKTLDIKHCCSLEEIEIAAFELQSLELRGSNYRMMKLSKIELIAPQLSALEIFNSGLKICDVERVVSKLLSLKSLYLAGFAPTEKKLKLSGPKLEKFKLIAWTRLVEMKLNAVPCLEKFQLRYDESLPPDQIKECVIENSAASCQWEVDFWMRPGYSYDSRISWFVDFKSFIARFPKFHTVSVYLSQSKFALRSEELDCTIRPTDIQHLKLQPYFTSTDLSGDILNGLFWACHPRFLTMLSPPSSDGKTRLFQDFLSHYVQDPVATDDSGKKLDGYVDWRHQLKTVRIITEDSNYLVEKEKGLVGVLNEVSVLLETENYVELMLTWH